MENSFPPNKFWYLLICIILELQFCFSLFPSLAVFCCCFSLSFLLPSSLLYLQYSYYSFSSVPSLFSLLLTHIVPFDRLPFSTLLLLLSKHISLLWSFYFQYLNFILFIFFSFLDSFNFSFFSIFFFVPYFCVVLSFLFLLQNQIQPFSQVSFLFTSFVNSSHFYFKYSSSFHMLFLLEFPFFSPPIFSLLFLLLLIHLIWLLFFFLPTLFLQV